MGYLGRKLRMRHLLSKDNLQGLIVPIDHGLTMGPIPGIKSLEELSGWIGSEHISAIIAHKGMLEKLVSGNYLHPSTGVIMQLNGMPNMSNQPNLKQRVAQVDHAVRCGADAVSLQVNFCADNYAFNIDLLGQITDQAHSRGLPVLAMVYDKANFETHAEKTQNIGALIRLASELGCDALKIGLPEDLDQLSTLVSYKLEGSKLFFAGGELMNDELFCAITKRAINYGADGLCVGRNIFQHKNPRLLLKKLSETMSTHCWTETEAEKSLMSFA